MLVSLTIMSGRALIKVGAEGLGTFFLSCAVGITLSYTTELAPFLISATLFSAMGFTGFISGAMFNPAVTLGKLVLSYLSGTLSQPVLKLHSVYTFVQFVSGLLGAIAAWGITGRTHSFEVGAGYSNLVAFTGECIWSVILVGSALNVGVTNDTKLQSGLCVAAAVLSGGIALGPISGGVLNPAIGIGIGILGMLDSRGHLEWPVYLIAPMLGGFLAGALVYLFHQVLEPPKEEAKVHPVNANIDRRDKSSVVGNLDDTVMQS